MVYKSSIEYTTVKIKDVHTLSRRSFANWQVGAGLLPKEVPDSPPKNLQTSHDHIKRVLVESV